MRDLSGKVAVVTGAASGMGEGMARALAAEGCRVVIADIMADRAEVVAKAIVAGGGQAIAVACDISDRASVRALKAEVDRQYGPASILIPNAGVTVFKPLMEMTDEEVDWVLAVDLHGVFHCLRAFVPDMIAAGEGHVLATSSFSGLICSYIGDHAPYVAAKSGVIGLMLSMRRELEPHGVGATVLCPGKVATRITESFLYRPERFGGPSAEGITLPTGDNTQDARSPDAVGRMVVEAIRENRAVIVTDPSAKEYFRAGYCEPILEAFDAVAEWERQQR